MNDFTKRSNKKEILDRDDIPFADIKQNMQELNFINTYLGGHAISIQGLTKLIGDKKSVTICEIGCGGGDNLTAINNFCKAKNIKAKFTGIDINANCIAFAKEKTNIACVEFIISDYREVVFTEKPDVIFSSLFCHHFTNEELTEMLKWMQCNCTTGFFINDLHRHPLAYYFIKGATKLFSKSYLVKNDAPLSVLRGFKKSEWQNILQRAGIKNYTLQWRWAFRYLIVAKNE
jgi:2-polyprenyl-3-methyl-5-hydroxy-6-metoxy-1,4-benzoquinol methylase